MEHFYFHLIVFFFFFTLFFSINTLFFSDSTMHKIYEDEGSFNFIYQIPIILYSSIICGLINLVVSTLSLTERNILQLKIMKVYLEEKFLKLIKFIKFKFTLFFLLSVLFLIFFWYYISCFCAIYRNTQMHLIKDTLICFSLTLIYPFGIYLLPGIFRIPSLKAKDKNRECIYKISNIIQLI